MSDINHSLFSEVIEHAVMLFYSTAHLLLVQRLLNAPKINDADNRLYLELQTDEVIAHTLNFGLKRTRILLNDLFDDKLVTMVQINASCHRTVVNGMDANEHGIKITRWGIDMNVAIDVIYFRLHKMRKKLDSMLRSSENVNYHCSNCNSQFSLTDAKSFRFDGSGDALCTNWNCSGHKLNEVYGPSSEMVIHCTRQFDKETVHLYHLLQRVYNTTPPVYRWPVPKPAKKAKYEPQSTYESDETPLPEEQVDERHPSPEIGDGETHDGDLGPWAAFLNSGSQVVDI